MLAGPAIANVAIDQWAFDDAAIRRLVGADTARRGREYADRGAVLAISATGIGATLRLHGRVAGNGRSPYTIVVVQHRSRLSSSSCSCPVRAGCKHVAALLYEAAGRRAAQPQSEWERLLTPEIAGNDAEPSEEFADLGLQFELTKRSTAGFVTPRLEVRPALRNPAGTLVRSGLTWSSLQYRAYAQYSVREGQRRVLEDIWALNAAGRTYPYSYSREDRVYLDSFPGRWIWDVLVEARSAGLTLATAGKSGGPVRLEEDAAAVSLDVDATSADWGVRALITTQGGEIPAATALLLGTPAHAIAWWPNPETAGPRCLSIAPLARPLDAGLRQFFADAASFTIPALDQPRFLRDVYPGLRRRIGLSSANASFEPPEERTHLALTARHAPGHEVEVRWSWAQSIGDTHRDLALWEDDLTDPHGPPSGRELPAGVGEHTAVLGGLYQDEPEGRRLAAVSTLTGMDAIVFTRDVLPALRNLADVEVHEAGDEPQYREATDAPTISLAGRPGPAGDWFDLAVTVSVDGEDVPFRELFVALAENHTHLILPTGTYFSIDRPEFHQLRALISEARGVVDHPTGSVRLSRFQASLWAELEALGTVSKQAAGWSAGVRRLQDARATVYPRPQGVQATLRPYQEIGFNWLAFLHEYRLGGVLADDMGLGKTLQAISLICHAREQQPDGPPFLVVAPTSVVGNWASECHRFAPSLNSVAIVETAPRRGISLRRLCRGKHLVITSYALFRIEFEDYSRLKWSGLMLDEAQAIKNHQSRGYQCARKLRAPFKLAITGTPMENNLMELWSMFSITAPGLFPDPRHFGEAYRTPIERDGNTELLGRLQRRISPLLMRRTKEQVATDLPDKLEQVIELDLNPQHRRIYQTYLQRERQKVLGLIGDMRKNRFEIFKSLTLLRQASIDPSLVDPKHRRVASTKLDALMEHLGEAIGEGHRALVFSQFTRFLSRVRTAFDREGIEYCYLDGATRNRPSVVRAFKTGSAPVFLISLKAGGVGLNLPEADYCFLLDPWWNPATEAQAVDRAHRIGQTRKVMAYRFVARDTIEEKVMALKAKKQALFNSVIDGGGARSSTLTADDIRALIE